MRGALPSIVLGFLALAALLFVVLPRQRRRVRVSVLIFSAAFVGTLVAAQLLYSGAASADDVSYIVTRASSLFFYGVAIANIVSILLFDVLLALLRFHPPHIVRDLMLGLVYVILAFVNLSYHGANVTGLFATSAVITAVIGFSLADTLGNIMGGLALQMERTITIGDWIRVNDIEGRVKELHWRQTSIETRNWDTVVIPNSVLMRSNVILLGRREGQPMQHRMWVYFNVDFRFAPTDVIDAVQSALRSEPIPNVAADPPPNCVFMDFKDSYAAYAVRYWLTDMAVDDPTNSIVRQRIYFALRRAGIPQSIPAHALFLTEDKEKRRDRKHHEEIDKRTAALKKVDLFRTLNPIELTELAESLSVAPFARGEAMTLQGREAHHLYLLTRGEAEVRLDGNNGSDHTVVAKLKPGDFFGEMGLMTGAPRRATIVALSDSECYRLEKAAFDSILRKRPKLAHEISEILARRNVELESARENLDEEAKARRMKEQQGDLLDRIKHFFTLD
ncbi:MAG TPA: mechanosensitive ion channel family protein [Planctomycetota bacterium]|nr:mechanosensitive ion channel family protein [Planctomycetota bacterium]